MRRRHLEMALSSLSDIDDPSPKLEQYRTPPRLVADILWHAMELGNIIDRSVIELGCGGAAFAIGALMMGARSAVGLDIDNKCIDTARSNLERSRKAGYVDEDAELSLIRGDVSDPELILQSCDTVLMNPPFGAQNRHADRDFIRIACEKGSVVFSIHNGGTESFLRNEYSRSGATDIIVEERKMEIPHRFHFHRRNRELIDILIVTANIER